MTDVLNLPEWTTFPDPDDIATRLDGSDDTLVVLWPGRTIVGTMRDIVRDLIRWEEDERGRILDDGPAPVDAAYVRRSKALVSVSIWTRRDASHVEVTVIGPLGASEPIAAAKYPAR